jgi:hypothetical protein
VIEPKLNPDQRKLVDEYVEVRKHCAAWKPSVNPHAARLAQLEPLLTEMAGFNPVQAKETFVLRGDQFVVPLSARRLKRTILQIPKLFKLLGTKWVAEHCAPTLTDLEKSSLTEKQLKSFILEEQSGQRTLGEPAELAAVKAA